MTTLEDVLRRVSTDFNEEVFDFSKEGQPLTKHGQEALDRLSNILFDLVDIGVLSEEAVNRGISELDEITNYGE